MNWQNLYPQPTSETLRRKRETRLRALNQRTATAEADHVISETARLRNEVDIKITSEGSLFLFTPKSQVGREFLSEHAPEDAQWFGLSLVIEHRYANDWAMNAVGAGLTIA